MANDSGKGQIPPFVRGKRIPAKILNRLVDHANTRILGGGSITVQSTPRGVIVTDDPGQKHPAPESIIAKLAVPTGNEDPVLEMGEYNFVVEDGPGPSTGRAFELQLREGLPADLMVVMRRSAGIWYFDGASIEVWYEITSEQDNTLGVKLLQAESNDVVEGAPELTIWKPWDLQRQAYDALTLDGVTYNYVGAQERTSFITETETEIVIPRYYVGGRVSANLLVPALPGGFPNRMVDCNRAGRFWSKEFA